MRPRVIIVEDDYFAALSAKQILTLSGFSVVGLAGHVSSAVRTFDTEEADVVLLDANPAGETAEPLSRKLRNLAIPFVVVVDHGNCHPGDWAKGAPVLTRPYSREELVCELDRILNSGCRGEPACRIEAVPAPRLRPGPRKDVPLGLTRWTFGLPLAG